MTCIEYIITVYNYTVKTIIFGIVVYKVCWHQLRALHSHTYSFKWSTYVQELLVIGRRGCVQREI